MAVRNRRFTCAAVALPLFWLVMVGWARATIIVVNTLDSGTSDAAPLCTLEEAVLAANNQTMEGGCPAGTGLDTILFSVTGTIYPDATLVLDNPDGVLFIEGPAYSGGITINGQSSIELIEADDTDYLGLENLTLTEGASEYGGALLAEEADVGIEGCTFDYNLAGDGGAIAAFDAEVYVLNDTFSEDSAYDEGGAILAVDALFFTTNDTFSMNDAEYGADIASDAETVVNSSIFADSSSGGNCDGYIIDAGYNISDDDSCGFSGTSVNDSTTLNLDPLGLQNNGGPTQTIAIQSDSQANNFIPIADCLDLFGTPVTTDQRGFGRPDPANLNFCDAGAFELDAVPTFVLVTNGGAAGAAGSERLQIARSSNPNSDKINLAITFTENGAPTCAMDQDALNSGFDLKLYEGTCEDNLVDGLQLTLSPFVVHVVNHESYGTLFQMDPPVTLQQSTETVSARLVALPTPPAPACGEWTLNLEVTGLDTSSYALDLGGTNPFALVLTTTDGEFGGCFDITNAIVGNQIDPPKRTVRRGVRR
jgi:hypothetical protein